jgi:hypothetical protein
MITAARIIFMARNSLNNRVTALEAELARLKRLATTKSAANGPTAWWERIAGAFAQDPAFTQAMRMGKAYRKSLTPVAVKASAKRSAGKRRNGHPRHRSS